MVARDSVVRCCRVRCQPIGASAGVQSRVAELLADPQHQFDGLRGVARGELCGRLDRGSNAASPSAP
jgi:hypothetical protein